MMSQNIFGVIHICSIVALLGGGLLVAHAGGERPSVTPSMIPVLNVKDMGAMGDGKADDTAAIQQAIDIAGQPMPDNAGGFYPNTVFFPQGTYRITQTLKIDPKRCVGKLEGCGWLKTQTNGEGYSIIKWDGAEGQHMVNIPGYHALRISDIAFDGGNKADIILRINSIPGVGTAQFYIERTNLRNGGTGIEYGADLDMCASDCTFVDLVIERMKTCGFRTMGQQNVNYVFIRPQVGYTPVGFHFQKGGSAYFTLPCFGRVQTAFRIENAGINNGMFNITGLWLENFSYKSEKRRIVILEASGEANVKIQSISTMCSQLWGDDPDLETPNFILGPSAQVSVEDSLISGRIAKLTGGQPKDAENGLATWIQFDNCRFRCQSDPRKDIQCDAYSGFELRNCHVMLDDTFAKDYNKSLKAIMIPSYAHYPKQAQDAKFRK